MVVQHNIPALNSHRYLGVNNNAAAKNLEKLSSGFKINRAGDDAAGLAISEKMRGQIRGLAKAEDNTNHAINLIQTAEGGMQEMHSIVQRMRELAVQSTNGTYHNAVDRAALDQEFQELKKEFDRIVDYTNYNNIKLLNGDPWGAGGGAGGTQLASVVDQTHRAGALVNGTNAAAGDFAAGNGGKVSVSIELDANGDWEATITDISGGSTNYTGSIDATGLLTISDGTPANDFTYQLDLSALQNMGEDDGDISKISFELEETGATVAVSNIATESLREVPKVIGAQTTDTTAQITDAMITVTGTTTGWTSTDFDLTITVDPLTGQLTGSAVDQSGTITGLTLTQTPGGTWTLTDGSDTLTITLSQQALDLLTNEEDAVQSLTFTVEVDGSDAATINGSGANDPTTTSFIANPAYTGGTGGAPGHQAGSDAIGQNTGTRASQAILFQVGANGTADQQVELTLWDMGSQWLGWGTDLSGCTNIETGYVLERYDANGDIVQGRGMVIDSTVNPTTYDNLSVYDLHIKDKNASNIAIEVLYTALNDVSSKRAELGAVQNRLEYTLNNLGVTKENLTAAESTIRDVDMAKEMMDFTKNSILIQSAQAMLAQANTLPQGVLQLLR